MHLSTKELGRRSAFHLKQKAQELTIVNYVFAKGNKLTVAVTQVLFISSD